MSKRELLSVESILQPNLSDAKKHQVSPIKWLYNLPIKSKQLLGLFTSETISIIGLVGVGAVLIVVAGRTQLLRQAEAELAVAQINYNIKINQMGSSFRAQSDNATIIAAASAHAEDESLPSELRAQVKQILQNEIKASNIEYATLVGKDRKIIVNANADRTGETFDPNKLVSQVLKNPQQLQASQIVSRTELAKEAPPLPKGLANQDALIRYTIAPVKDSRTGNVIGALVAGDIVNGKLPIVENTLKAFGGGYSAIYFRKPSGELTLATALDQGKAKDLGQAKPGVPLLDSSLLKKAVDTPGKIVTGRAVAGVQSYTVAAKALTDFSGKPVAVLVRGTQETALNQLLGDSLLLQVVISGITLAVDVWLAILLGQTIAQPLKRLQQTTQKFARGDRQVRAEIVTSDEVGQLAKTFNELADSIVSNEQALGQHALDQQAEAERAQAFAEFTSRLYKSLTVEDILQTLVDGIRILLQVDRAVVYYFNKDYQSGTIAAESVAPGWPQAMDQIINDPLGKEEMDAFRNGRVVVCNNIHGEGYSACHCEILEGLQVKANLVGPLFLDDKLLGLFALHQCSGPRVWQEQEVALFKQAAVQANLALKQAHLMEQLRRARLEAEHGRQKALEFSKREQARRIAELTSGKQRRQQEKQEELQRQVVALLKDIEVIAKGDLSVGAETTEDKIGTIADLFNTIIENLRQMVRQVKQSAIQVNASLGADEQAVSQLLEQAIKQADEITARLDSILALTSLIQSVADDVRKATSVTRIAPTATQIGETASDVTVDKIVNLPETVIETPSKASVLGESSKEIAKVRSLVQEISLQTELLAVNAGLEANRTDEDGEDFQVVAEQIGNLAKQAVNATHEIEQMLEVIQQNTTEVVEAMEEGKTQVIDSTHAILGARQNRSI